MEQLLPMHLETSPQPRNEVFTAFVRGPRTSVQTACLLSIEYLSLANYSGLNVPYRPAKKEGRELVQSTREDGSG